MKTIQKQFKSVALVLSMLILFQGCTVYKSVPISLEQAVQNESKVKVRTSSNEKLKFKRIGVKDGNYYGVENIKGNYVKTPLDPNVVKSINENDKTLSTILSIGIPVVIVGVIYVIVLASATSQLISVISSF